MRPALRERLLREESRGEAYSVLPLHLLAAEERAGEETVRVRLAEIFREHRGDALDRGDFIAMMGTGVIDLEEELP